MADFVKGCEAIAEAAVRAGCRFYSGYPITPQSEIMEYMSRRMKEVGGMFVQGESEIASINMVYGAASTGTRVMTSSSGPGMSLKTEGISYMAASRLPGVIVSAMRCGPGLGMIQPSQMDYWQAVKAPGHGGVKCMVIAPSTVQECVDYMGVAFDKSFRDRNPVIVLVDGCLCAIMEPALFPEMRSKEQYAKPDWSLSGSENGGRHLIIPCLGEPEDWEQMNLYLNAMYERWEREDVIVDEYMLDDAQYVIAAYGTSARICKTVIKELRRDGIKIGMIRPITLSPFPKKSFEGLNAEKVKTVIDVEMAIPAQMIEDVERCLKGRIPIRKYCRAGGVVPSMEEIVDAVKKIIAEGGSK